MLDSHDNEKTFCILTFVHAISNFEVCTSPSLLVSCPKLSTGVFPYKKADGHEHIFKICPKEESCFMECQWNTRWQRKLTFGFIKYIWSQDNVHRWQRDEFWGYLPPRQPDDRCAGKVIDVTRPSAVLQAQGKFCTVWQDHMSPGLCSHYTGQTHPSTELKHRLTLLLTFPKSSARPMEVTFQGFVRFHLVNWPNHINGGNEFLLE